MTESNQTPQAATANASVPTLTLDPASMAKDKANLDEAVDALQKAGSTPSAARAVVATMSDMDTSMLSDADKQSIDAFVKQINIENPDHVLLYGADAQKKVADFSDSALATVRTDQTGEVGDMLVKLVSEIKGFGSEAEKPSGFKGLFWNAQKAIEEMKSKYEKVEVNVDGIATSLENYQRQLLKDVSMFNHLYDMNTQYFKELTMYIIAGG
ncbi:MAG: toxic anion resistance protein, partial [Eubacteriales bacterium]|nr:toxic anion resistance protein [Eubacteriales bacterium]